LQVVGVYQMSRTAWLHGGFASLLGHGCLHPGGSIDLRYCVQPRRRVITSSSVL